MKDKERDSANTELKCSSLEYLQEYAESHKFERKATKSLPRKLRLLWRSDIKDFVVKICDEIGIPRIRRINLTTDMPRLSITGYYSPPYEITLKSRAQYTIMLVLHELAHHVCHHDKNLKQDNHGKDFLWAEIFLFDVFKELYKV